jgi:putative transposase/transposase-like zinc-binding protein
MSKITVCDILRDHGSQYIQKKGIKGQQKGIIKLLSSCQSSALGSHFRKCNNCSQLDKVYNSCRNRHCPNCQNKDREKWLEKRMQELLPIGYYHLVFTIPHELNQLCLQNKKQVYDILFKAASQTILELSMDTKHLGADTGLITVLHTWGQNMMEHPHLHCIMPAGGLSFDKSHWVYTPKGNDFFIYYKVLSSKFRGKFLDLLQKTYDKGKLSFKGKQATFCRKKNFEALLKPLYKKGWVVNIQKPFAHPQKVLEYLSRYVFRIAISDRRIDKVEDGMVYFTIKDYKRKGIFRKMKLSVDEFIRRFLLHLLPKGFFKVRYYGIFANIYRKVNIEKVKELLSEEQTIQKSEDFEDGKQTWDKHDTVWKEIMDIIKQVSKNNCPVCKKGRMVFVGPVLDNRDG